MPLSYRCAHFGRDELSHASRARSGRDFLYYLGLGMSMDAWNELEEIDAKDRTRPEVLKLRVEVCCALEKREMMAEVSRF